VSRLPSSGPVVQEGKWISTHGVFFRMKFNRSLPSFPPSPWLKEISVTKKQGSGPDGAWSHQAGTAALVLLGVIWEVNECILF
jgi:hypothetical protein